jgi:16S rRNA processing protein RimM
VAENPRFFAVAHLLRPRGNKGELAAQLLTDFPERLTKLKEVFLSDAKSKAEPRQVALKNCWLSQNHQGQAVFHFENINSINDAEKLRGLDVLLPIDQRVTLPAGHYFVADLVGCSVFELPAVSAALSSSPCALTEAPSLLGTVSEVQFPGDGFPGTPLLVVDLAAAQQSAETDMLIPLAEDICTRIDTVARRIEVILPDGLRDLNALEEKIL